MEKMRDPIDDQMLTHALTISDQGRRNLDSTAGWGKFLAILGFILVGFLVLLALLMGSFLSTFSPTGIGDDLPFPPVVLSVFYLLIAAVYLLPILYLYRFSTKMKTALQQNDQMVLERSFANLKALYQFTGIVAIVFLVLYGLGILSAIFFAGSLASLGS